MADPSGSDDRVLDGAEPTEEVGPGECEAGIAEVEQEMSPPAMGEDLAHAEFALHSELDDAFPTEPIPVVLDPTDGLPAPQDQINDGSFAHPFTFEDVICVEDDRQWAEVFRGEAQEYAERYGALPPELAERLKFAAKYDADGEPRTRRTFQPGAAHQRWGHRVVALEGAPNDYILVRPIRERCVHYKRQLTPVDGAPGSNYVWRNCTARRSIGGAYLALGGEAIYACDYRSPQDVVSIEQRLDGPDRVHLRSNAHLERVPAFGLREQK